MIMSKNNTIFPIFSAILLLASASAFSQPKSLDSSYKVKTPFAAKVNIKDVERVSYQEVPVITMPATAVSNNIEVNSAGIGSNASSAVYVRDNKYDYNAYTGPQQGLNFKKLNALAPANAKRITDLEPTSNADFKDGSFAPTLPVNGLQVKTKQVEQPKVIERKTIRAIPDRNSLYPWQRSPKNNQQNNRLNGGGAPKIENEPVNGSFFF